MKERGNPEENFKKVVQRCLPLEVSYQIVDTYTLPEMEYLACDNCGKIIRNVA